MEKTITPLITYFITQGAFAIAFAVMVYILLTEIKKIRDKIGKELELLITISSVITTISEQINNTVSKLLEIIDRKVK